MAIDNSALGRQSANNSEIDKNIHAISILGTGRKFQMWRYYVSHRTLLIRSPKVDAAKENIDIVITGVTYIRLRTSYEYLSFELGTDTDRNLMETQLGRALTDKERVFCLTGDGWRDHVVALGVYPSVNSSSLHETPDLPSFEAHEVHS